MLLFVFTIAKFSQKSWGYDNHKKNTFCCKSCFLESDFSRNYKKSFRKCNCKAITNWSKIQLQFIESFNTQYMRNSTWSKWNLYLKLLFLGLKMKCSINFYFEIPPCRKLFSLTWQNRRFLPKTTNLVTRNNYHTHIPAWRAFKKKLLFTVIFRPNMIIVDSILEKTTMHSSFIR